MMNQVLEVRNVSVHYAKAQALKEVSLAVPEGSIVTIVGANGAGKSTLLRTISGLISPTVGEIWFEGKPIHGCKAHEIARLGIAHVPEGRMVFAPMTVLENLQMGAHLRRDRQKVDHDLESVFNHFPVLKQRYRQKAGSLSGGEQQMLAIARSLMSSPRLVLMDEPSMGLSPLLVKETAHIVSDINRAGVSIVLVEQNARMALNLAHTAYILEVGQIVLGGDAREIARDERVKKAYLGG
jgi:branched-chain amino acid transport system ATP-binding protein